MSQEEFSLVIDDMTQDGMGVGHLSAEDRLFLPHGSLALRGEDPRVGKAVFVAGVLPGDTVRVRSRKEKKQRIEADLIEILRPSAHRRVPPCPHAAICDGCALIAWEEHAQRDWKMRTVRESLVRIGGIAEETIPDFGWISETPLGYRNKLNLRLTPDGRLGYTKRGSHDVFPITDCVIADPRLSALIARWQEMAERESAWVELSRAIRMVVLRSSSKGECMVVLITDPLDDVAREALFSHLAPLGVDVLCQSENRRPGDVRITEPVRFATKETHLETQMSGLSFELSPASFFQVNRFLTPKLYETAIAQIGNDNDVDVLDLYCGTGTTSLLLAQRVAHVVGVEVVPEAVRDARRNAQQNGIPNVSFLCGRAEDLIEVLTEQYPSAHLALVDPPRKGLDEAVRRAIASSAIQQLIYISCNPATLARDVKHFCAAGFRLESVTVCDMFAQTAHVETVVLMLRT